MSKRHRNSRPIDPIAKLGMDLGEWHREEAKVMAAFVNAFAADQRYQQQFRAVVLMELAKIEHRTRWILTGQVAQNEKLVIWHSDKFQEEVKEMEKRISESSHQVGIELLKFVYDDSEAKEQPKKGRKRGKTG